MNVKGDFQTLIPALDQWNLPTFRLSYVSSVTLQILGRQKDGKHENEKNSAGKLIPKY